MGLGLAADSVESKRGSGDTPTRRVCLCEVLYDDRFHDLGILASAYALQFGNVYTDGAHARTAA